NSTARRTNGSGSLRAVCSSLAAAASSRKRGNGLSLQREVASEDEDPCWDVVASPLREAFEARAQAAEMLCQADFAQAPAACGGAAGQVQFGGLDVPPGEISHACDGWIVLGDKDRELPQRAFDAVHGGGTQGEADLLDIGTQGRGQSGWNRSPLRF